MDARRAQQSKILQGRSLPERGVARSAPAPQAADRGATAALVRDGESGIRRDDFLREL